MIVAALVCLTASLAVQAAGAGDMLVPGGELVTAVPPSRTEDRVVVAPFRLDRVPITNAEFAAFVARFPEWSRNRAPSVFVDPGYLEHWPTPAGPDAALASRAVTNVSWFAADAYCAAHDGRLPTWHEWELAAAASETATDARGDAGWRQRILSMHATAARSLSPVGMAPANVYGVADLHGMVWEWVEDFNGLLVSADNREQDGSDLTKFCGAGALALAEKDHYAIQMRIAVLASLDARDSTSALGFRCARDAAVPE
jgi:formylglycine-generating enzyme required for sulfatase activity